MTKHHHSWVNDMTYLAKVGAVTLGVLGTVSGAVWGVSEYTQSYVKRTEIVETTKSLKEDLVVAGTKANYVLDQQIESLVIQIDRLRHKSQRTRGEEEQLHYLEKQLELTRRIREGK